MEASSNNLWHMPPAEVLEETKDFQLEKGTLRMLEALKGAEGYRIRNKRTNVIELEGTRLAEAIRALHGSQQYLDEVDADPTDKHQRAARQKKLEEFEQMFSEIDELP